MSHTIKSNHDEGTTTMEQIERWITEAETVVLKNATLNTINVTANETLVDFDLPEEEHDTDAYSTTILNVTIIACLLLAYCVKQYRLYFLPESAGALIIGCLVGAIARLVTDNLQFFEFVSFSSRFTETWNHCSNKCSCVSHFFCER